MLKKREAKSKSNSRIVVFEPDLLFSSRIESEATRLGADVEIVTDLARLLSNLTDSNPALLILNLDSLKNDITRLSDGVRVKSLACVGYYSHVNTQLAQEAKRAEIGMIMPRGVFVKRIREIIVQVLRG